jgi:hypothetical protein
MKRDGGASVGCILLFWRVTYEMMPETGLTRNAEKLARMAEGMNRGEKNCFNSFQNA